MRIPNSLSKSKQANSAGGADRTMTPMIDVVFLLLIFFVCASLGQVRDAVLPSDLGAGTITSEVPREQTEIVDRVFVKLKSAGFGQLETQINDQPIPERGRLKSVLTELAAIAPASPVILDVGPDVAWGDMIDVYDICMSARFDNIYFATDAKPASAKSRSAKTESAQPGP